jgi:hypothetical protein
MKRSVYVLLTEQKIHAFGSWSRAIKISQRASRMGAKYEFMSTEVKTGDRFKKVAITEPYWGEVCP